MSLKYLAGLAGKILPVCTSDQVEIAYIELLVLAGFIKADLPQSIDGVWVGSASVGELTPNGYAEINAMKFRAKA